MAGDLFENDHRSRAIAKLSAQPLAKTLSSDGLWSLCRRDASTSMSTALSSGFLFRLRFPPVCDEIGYR